MKGGVDFNACAKKLLSPLLIILYFTVMGFAVSSFAFEQGREWKVARIRFEGNRSLDSRELLSVMRLRPSGFFRKHTISDDRLAERLRHDSQSIEALYRFRGWYGAAVKSYDLERDSSKNKIHITMKIYEGEQYVIGALNFLSSDYDYENENCYRESVKIFPGDPLDSALIELGRIRLINALNDEGHLFASVIYHIDFPKQSDITDSTAAFAGDVSYIIQRGPVTEVGGVEIFGLKHVKPKIVERDLVFDTGDVITPAAVEKSKTKLYSTDLFSSVFIIPVDTLGSAAELDTVPAQIAVIVTEKDMAAISGGVGYGSYARWFVNLQFTYRNLFGLGHQVSAIAKYSHYDKGGQLNYVYPHLFGNFADAQAGAYGERRLKPDYDGVFWGGNISVVNKPVNPLLTWRATVRAEHISSLKTDHPTRLYPRQPVKDTYALGGQLRSERQLNSKNPVAYESRLNNLTPVRSESQTSSTNYIGWTADVRGEIAGPFLRATNQFYTILPTLRLYYPVLSAANITGVSGVQGAFGAGYGNSSGLLPVQERFWIGFGTLLPVRGFNITELMPKDESGEARGAGAVLSFTPLELRMPVYWRFQGALFVDVGHAWRNPGGLNMEDLRTAIGPGIMIPTAQGVIRLDYGIQIPQGRSRVSLYIENF